MSCDEPLYTTTKSVRVRLANKVQFQSDPDECLEGELSDELFLQLIRDAETSVEQDLRSRYAIPFRSVRQNSFVGLPDHTQRAIRMVCDMKAVITVLTTDFGRGSHIDSSNYSQKLEDTYMAEVRKLLGQDMEGQTRERFRFSPPLEDLMLAGTNAAADDGYKGKILVTGGRRQSSGAYAENQINDPSLYQIGPRIW